MAFRSSTLSDSSCASRSENLCVCPLCDKPDHMKKAKRLYGTMVCKRCYDQFMASRRCAALIDVVAWYFFTGLLIRLIFVARDFVFIPNESVQLYVFLSDVVVALIVLLLSFAFGFCSKDSFRFASPGKWMFSLVTIDIGNYQRVNIKHSMKRNLIWLVHVIPLGILNLAWCFLVIPLTLAWPMGEGERWGDHWAGTRVVRKKHIHHPVFTGFIICRRCGYDLCQNTTDRCPECGESLTAAQQEKLAQRKASMA